MAAPPTFEKREAKKKKYLTLKATKNDSSKENSYMAYLIKKFQKMVRKNGEVIKRDSSNRSKNNDLCYKCGKAGHFMKNCPILKEEFSKNFKRKSSAEYDSTFALLARSDDDEDNHNKEVNHNQMQKMRHYSQK
ncbi:uncharacterized protein LOC107817117 [Nicotiana tabacum]|uniref:CCHC-type domain-containing protein n=5 Tax=Nicotiana TaxID=4085 RepID=A0A1S3Z924_TOBAC|nr:PREDICTED: uncharacterized protein LOC104243602 [Nicotiana sylvestris]XP_016460712.1 PREDICTED: uncharacterized protein LOC107784124 [Nicotiana tabacum]